MITISASQLQELTRDGHDISTTVIDFGSAQIKLSTKGDLSLIQVSGSYSRALGREIERISLRCPGNIGLEFQEVRRDPSKRQPLKFDSSMVTLLKHLRARCHSKGKVFALCTPPAELVEFLKLLGVHDEFSIVQEGPHLPPLAPAETLPEAGAIASTLVPDREGEVKKRHILHFNQSLKRTLNLERGLDSAQRCVQKLLPQVPPLAEGYEFAFFYRSSEKVGGDFFDFISLPGQAIGIAIGDVSGHGLDAALVMGISKKLINIRARDPRFSTPSAVLRQVNADLATDLSRQTFVTALYGVLDLSSGAFRFARAGHELPIHFRPGGPQRVLKCGGSALGPGIGSRFDALIDDALVLLTPGDYIFLCTDGLAECRNPKDAIYTRERLLFELGRSSPAESCQQLLDRLLESTQLFASGRAQEDDMTAILIYRLAVEAPGKQAHAAAPSDAPAVLEGD
jgi:serine phosphatase RsbU (regulator of sigma subunit)